MWEIEDFAEYRLRLIHCLKNLAIFGFLNVIAGMVENEVSKSHRQPSRRLKAIPETHELPTDSPHPLFPRLLIALRPWSFPASLSPLLICCSVLLRQGNLDCTKALVFAVGILALQASANLLNSFCDFRNGLDKKESSGDRTLVDALVTKTEFPFLFLSLILVWLVSFIFTVPSNLALLQAYLTVYAVGVSLAVLYSAGSKPLKFIGFGDLAVFLSFGPLLVVAAAIATSLKFQEDYIFKVLLAALPAALLVVAILQANNHRDRTTDAKAHARTVSVRLGESKSIIYFAFLVLAPPALSVLVALLVPELRGSACGCLILPLGWRLTRLIRASVVPRDIDAQTAKLMMMYGVACSLGICLL